MKSIACETGHNWWYAPLPWCTLKFHGWLSLIVSFHGHEMGFSNGFPTWETYVINPCTLSWFNITMENHHFQWVNPPINVILNSYVSLPEGKSPIFPWFPLKMATGQFPKFFWQSLVLPPESPSSTGCPSCFPGSICWWCDLWRQLSRGTLWQTTIATENHHF